MHITNHLTNILNDIVLLNNSDYKINNKNINIIKNNLKTFKDSLDSDNDVLLINLAKLKETSNLIYELNTENSFSELTDRISNELYAFEFLLQEKLKERN